MHATTSGRTAVKWSSLELIILTVRIDWRSPVVYTCSVCEQDAVAEYVELMKKEAGIDKVPDVTVEDNPVKCLPPSR